MRDIKFRCFDKQTKQMSPPFTLFGEFLLIGAVHAWQHECGNDVKNSLEALKDLEVMQFTGLKDKHGKEIYDGDILNWDFCGSVQWSEWMAKPIYKVQYYNGYLPAAVGIYKELFLHAYRFQYTEVLGNIYENPELCQ